MRISRRRPSPATVIALIALFVAMGGTAMALKGKNAVRNDDVQNLRWTTLELRNGWIPRPTAVHYVPSVALDAQGVVHLRGAIEQPTGTEQVAFVLPPKYRPSKALDILGRASTVSFVGLQITRDGEVKIQPGLGYSASLAREEVSLNGATFWGGGN